MCHDQVFLDTPDGKMTCCPAREVTVNLGRGESILGRTVRKILPMAHDYSAPFKIVEVSVKGFLSGQPLDGTGIERFKFVDYQIMWLFSDQVPAESKSHGKFGMGSPEL
jgi:hypothetical protein